jgi:hypothetical protein
MAVVEGKSPAERNKMIAAIALGGLAVISLAYMFLGSSSKPNPPKGPTPSPTLARVTNPGSVGKTPPEAYIPTEIVYNETPPSVGEAGRNIFAFYVPPPPTPTPTPTPIPPIPAPTPNINLASISPVNVYAHTGDFNLDVTGDKFTPETRIYMGGGELQTRFVSPQQLSAKVPAQLISFEGGREVKVQSPDGKLFSNTATLNVMPAPQPNVTFIGVFNKPGSNDVAILKDKNGAKDLLSVQRGDIVGGRFRVMSISVREVKLEDTNLKIKYTLAFVGDNSSPSGPRTIPPPQPPPSDEGGDGEP